MSGVNKVILVGRLGKDPELRTLENGTTVANFSLATSETYKDKTTGEKKEMTEWHNVVMWKKLGEIAGKYLSKGSLVYIEGKLKTRSWEKDNVTRYSTEVVGEQMTMLGGGKSASGSGAPTASESNTKNEHEPAVAGGGSDDLPF